jgi:hypothetical protein
VLDDYRIGSFRLRSVPCVHLLIDGRERFLLGNELLGFGVAGPSAEQGQRDWADVRLQCFPGLIAYRAWRTSCTIELLLSGDKAISSEAAASTIQNAG